MTSGGSRKFWWGGFEAQNLKNSDVFTKIESRNVQQPQNLVHFRLRPITFIYLHYLQFL